VEFLEKLYQRKEVYENELIMAKAKVCVINELIDEFAVIDNPVEENQPANDHEELAHIDESY
jgi:hypothetical protein